MNAHPRWPVVLFDLDGTLVNTIDVIVASYQYAWDAVAGRQVSREEILPWIGRTLPDVFTQEAPEQAVELERVYMDFNEAHLDSMVTGFDGIPELLADLNAAGIRTGVATSKRRRTAIPSLRIARVPAETVLACAMDDTTVHKPRPEPLLKGLEVMGEQAEGSCYVGDAVHDLKAAHAAGMAGIGVTWGAGSRDDLLAQPHVAVIDTVDELRAALLG